MYLHTRFAPIRVIAINNNLKRSRLDPWSAALSLDRHFDRSTCAPIAPFFFKQITWLT